MLLTQIQKRVCAILSMKRLIEICQLQKALFESADVSQKPCGGDGKKYFFKLQLYPLQDVCRVRGYLGKYLGISS